MANVSQPTENGTGEPQAVCWSTKLWPYIRSPVVGAIFVGLALAFAVVFTGYGSKHRFGHEHTPRNLRSDCPKARKFREVGVKISNIQKYPFVGALISKRPYLFLCTVVVLTNMYLLTGANCFMPNFQNLRVRVGSDLWNSNGCEYGVWSFIINEEFNGTTMENNIALVRVKKAIIMEKNIRPVEMATSGAVRTKTGIVLGWNYWFQAERQRVRLVEQELFIWKAASCRKHLGNETRSKFICASLNNARCNLDLTGPLIVNGQLVGFWSWGLSCSEVPSVFTNLHYYKRWILGQIRV